MQAEFDYSKAIHEAYSDILHLKFEDAETVLDDVQRENPANLLPEFYRHYILFLKTFIAEEDAYYDALEEYSKRAIDKLKAVPESPYKRYLQADVLIRRALARAKFQKFIRAGWDLNRANRLLEQNKKRYPDFIYSDKGLSLIHSFFGTLSGFQRGVISLFTSIEASIEKGVSEINAIANRVDQNSIHQTEILLAQALIALHIEKNEQRAWRIIQSQALPGKSPLVQFFRASLAFQMRKHEKGRSILTEYYLEKESFPFYYLRYMYGVSLLNGLSPEASGPIMEFVQNFKGKTYLKEACQKMAWYHLVIKNDVTQYQYWITKVGDRGTRLVGEDVSAAAERETRKVPNRILLKARLLYDGGHYEKSLELLLKNDDLANQGEDRVEYIYRLGRLYEALDEYDSAKMRYRSIISHADQNRNFFKCNAALRLGIMSEEMDEKENAYTYYNLCLSIDPPYFGKSLHQKAKFGLRRIKKR